VRELFHTLRIESNKATHKFRTKHKEAINGFVVARKLAIWFHQSFGKSGVKFKPGPFIAPIDPSEQLRQLQSDIAKVKGELQEAIIEDDIRPRDSAHLVSRISDEARPHVIDTLKRKEWAFWHQKLFSQLHQIGILDVEAFWAKQEFTQNQAEMGADFILNR
jgi:type I restriction enzyme R subunit